MKRLLLLLLLAVPLLALSSSEAAEKASAFTQGESLLALPGPLEVGSDSYWVYYSQVYPPTSQKLIVAVSEYYGSLVEDEGKLSKVGEAVYDYGIVYGYINQNGYSFRTLSPAMNGVIGVLQRDQANLEDLISVTESKYPFLDFSGVQENLSLLVQAADEINVLLQDGAAQQQIFEDDYSAYSLSSLLFYYNSSFSRLGQFFGLYDDYLQSISTAQSAVYKSSIKAPDNENIYTSLENMKDIGVSSLYSKFAFSSPSTTLNALYGSRASWVNDSVSSFSYRNARKKATELYNANIDRYDYVHGSKSVLAACGLASRVSEVESDWAEVEYYNAKKSAMGYAKMLELLPPVIAEIDGVYAAYQSCVSQPTPSVQPRQETDYSWLIAALIALAVGLYAYNWWNKKREESA